MSVFKTFETPRFATVGTSANLLSTLDRKECWLAGATTDSVVNRFGPEGIAKHIDPRSRFRHRLAQWLGHGQFLASAR